MASFGSKSLEQLNTCDERLQTLFNKVVEFWDCTVIQGKRTEKEQATLVATGKSQTLQSKHVYPADKLSLAVDVAPYPVKWHDTNRFYAFAGFVLGVSWMLGIRVRWGGDWDSDHDLSDQKFNDLVHFELTD